MLTAFRALPLLWRAIAILVVLGSILGTLGGIYAYIRHQGFEDGYGKARAECALEKSKQEAANRQAIREAQELLDDAERELLFKEGQVDDLVKAIDLATAADPGGDAECISVDSVRRLDAIR